MPKIEFKHGLKSTMPKLNEAEPGFTTDTEEFFIGSKDGNIQFAKQSDLNDTNANVDTKADQTALDSTNATVTNHTNTLNNLANVNANAEIMTARGTYPLLGNRLDNVDSSLADITTLLPLPNGVDDTSNIQNLLNNISGKSLTISHDYIVGTPSNVAGTNVILTIVGQSNFKIKGNNGSIKLKDGTGNKTVLALIDCSNFEIDGLVIDGNKTNQTIVQSGVSGRFYSENCPAILLENAKTFEVKNCYLKNAQGDGIQLDVIYLNQSNTSGRQCEDGVIHGNTIDNIGRNGVSCVHSKNIRIRNNRFKNIQLSSTTLACGVDVEVNSGYLFRNESISIFSNSFYNCAVGVQTLMALADDVTNDIRTYMNEFVSCGVAGQFINLAPSNGRHIHFYLNKIEYCNNGVTFDACTTGRAFKNIIQNSTRTNSTNGFGIAIGTNRTGQNSNLRIEENTISDCDNVGIYADKLNSSVIIGNNIKNTSLSSLTTEKVSIRLLHSCDSVKINRNYIDDSASSPIGVTELGSTITNIEVANNDLTTSNPTVYWLVMANTNNVKLDFNRANGVTDTSGLGLYSYGGYTISAAQTGLVSGADTQIVFNSTVKSNSLFTLQGDGTIKVLQSGTYLLMANVTFALNATGRRQLTFWQNGGAIVSERRFPLNDFATVMGASWIVNCVANDVIKVTALQQSGAALDLSAATFNIKKAG